MAPLASIRLRYALGYAGILPFVAGALSLWLTPQWAAQMSVVLVSYGAVIASFMVGSLWPRVQSPAAIIATNVLCLTAWAAVVCTMFGYKALGVAAIALVLPSILLLELRCTNLAHDRPYYRLRTQLTTITILLHLLAIVGLSRLP